MNGHCCFGSIRNYGDFSSRDCTLVRKDCCSALKRPHSSVHGRIAEPETLGTPRTHDSWLDSKCSPGVEIGSG